jgi:hypothetical protein
MPLVSGCATIVGGEPHQAVTVQSTPAAASFTIRSPSGLQMAQRTTRSTVRFPRKNEYQIELTLDGYQPQSTVLTKSTNGLDLGQPPRWLAIGSGVDFLTGSAYELEPALIQVAMQRRDADI